MSLNPEPAAPEERAELNLPPKSYADAAEEALQPESHANGTDGAHDTNEHFKLGLKHKAGNANANGNANGSHTPSKPQTEKLEGVGLDASPKSPTRGHRRKGSRSSQSSSPRKNGDHTNGELYEERPNSHGDSLVTVKPSLELDKRDRRVDKRRNSELKSGRQAGAGWAASKCVYHVYSDSNAY
jgi:hypothetical protein